MGLSIIIVSSIGLFFGITLSIASKFLHVAVDHRVEEVENVLPNANCGACGYAGCAAFALAVVKGEASANGCTPGGVGVSEKIASLLGVDADGSVQMVAAIHCKGGTKEAKERAVYDGVFDCHAATLVGNGPKECQYGCYGLGSCVKECEFDAIIIENGIALIDSEKCVGCEACVISCPRSLISMIPKEEKIFLACNNHDRGAKVKKYCSVACTGCTLCVKAAPTAGSIEMVNFLPKLNYGLGENFLSSTYKCPSDCFTDKVKARPKANINSKCTGCGLCVPVCPVKNTITGTKGERYVIDKSTCIGCGLCAPVCPENAIALWGGLGYSDKDRRQGSLEIH
jgi:electron transport complex protein RnfB